MYFKAAQILRKNKLKLSNQVTEWIKTNHPNRTTEYDKCRRDISYIINSLAYCLEENSSFAIEHISTMFYTKGVFQLKSTNVEFAAYDHLLELIGQNFRKAENGSLEYCSKMLKILKSNLSVYDN